MNIVVLCFAAYGFASAIADLDVNSTGNKCGVEASSNPIHHNPWLVFLEFYRRGVRYDSRCGGTLVSRRHVVTAAHCVRRGLTKNLQIIARLGEYDLSSEVDCVAGVCADLPIKIRVADVTLHPGYDGKEHDIAIITLAHDAPYTDTIRPACLPSGELPKDVFLNAAGWGEESIKGYYSNIKKNLYLPHWSSDKCQRAYFNIPLPKHIICAGGERGIDTCRGDSGGPLTLHHEKGVTSFGNSVCGTSGYPGIYTSVIDHLDWIRKVVEK